MLIDVLVTAKDGDNAGAFCLLEKIRIILYVVVLVLYHAFLKVFY